MVLGLYLSQFPALKYSTHSHCPLKVIICLAYKIGPGGNNVGKHWIVAKITSNTGVSRKRDGYGSEDSGKAPGRVGLGLALSPSLLGNGV